MIRLVEGAHLTATNRRHLSQMIAAGMERGQSGRLAYTLAPDPERPGHWRYAIAQRERDMWNRPQIRTYRGLIEYRAK